MPHVTVACAYCGADVRKLTRELKRYPITYCDKVCSARARHRTGTLSTPTIVKRWLPIPAHRCEWCGDVFAARRKRKYCSPSCAYAVDQENKRRWYLVHRQGPATWVGGACPECGDNFTVRVFGRQRPCRFCSAACATRNQRRRAKARRSKRIQATATREAVNLDVVAQRDGWRCHICKRTVTRRTWSLDHLTPLVHGGSHTYANVALAHHRCNSLRGAPDHVQLQIAA